MVIYTTMTMKADIASPADQLQEMCAILAAIQREAASKGITEIAELLQRADRIVAAWHTFFDITGHERR